MKKSLESRYSKLKKTFPEQFIYLFDSKGELNSQGKMAQKIIDQTERIKSLKQTIHRAAAELKRHSLDISWIKF